MIDEIGVFEWKIQRGTFGMILIGHMAQFGAYLMNDRQQCGLTLHKCPIVKLDLINTTFNEIYNMYKV